MPETPDDDLAAAIDAQDALAAVSADQNPDNALTDAVEAVDAQQLAPMRGSLYEASKIDPGRHATVLEYADRFRIEPDLVDRNLEYFRGLVRRDDAVQGADLAEIDQRAPALAQWLADRDNAAISQDEMATMRRVHDAVQALNAPAPEDAQEQLPWVQAIGATLRRGVYSLSQLVNAIPASIQLAGRSLVGAEGMPSDFSPLAQVWTAQQIMDRERQAWETYRETTAQKLTLPVIGALGNPLNALPLAAGARAMAATAELSMVLREAIALRGAAGAMAAQTGVETLAETGRERQAAGDGAAGPILPTMADVSHAGLQAALAYATGTAGGLTGVLRSLREAPPSYAEAFGDVARQAVLGGGQSAGATELEGLFHGRRPDAGELLMAVATGGLSGGALAALNLPSATLHVAGAKLMREQLKATRAIEGAENLARAAVALETSKARERSPRRIQDLLAAIAKASGQDLSGTVYAQGSDWDAYWQSKGLDPEAVAEQLTGDPTAYARTVATGGKLAIPQESFLAKLAGTDHFAEDRKSVV